MKIVRNNFIPFKGFKAINLFGILFVRKEVELTSTVINHEYIHTVQMKELLYVFFYLWYLVEWIVRLFQKGNAYRHISFEREAYANEDDFAYLSNRKHYALSQSKGRQQWKKERFLSLSFASFKGLFPIVVSPYGFGDLPGK